MSTTRHEHHESGARKYSPNVPVEALLTRGVAAGLVGGLAFILVNMFAAQSAGKPPIAPSSRSRRCSASPTRRS